MNDEQASNFTLVVKFRIPNPFLHHHTASFPTLASFIVAWFHVTALGDPRQAHRAADCDNGVRH